MFVLMLFGEMRPKANPHQQRRKNQLRVSGLQRPKAINAPMNGEQAGRI